WQGNYFAAGGAKGIERLVGGGADPPQALAGANDQSALGVVHALTQHRLDVPGDLAGPRVDHHPGAPHLRALLATAPQALPQLGATAFEALYSMVCDGEAAGRNIMLPTTLIPRESCGCAAGPAPADRPAAG